MKLTLVNDKSYQTDDRPKLVTSAITHCSHITVNNILDHEKLYRTI